MTANSPEEVRIELKDGVSLIFRSAIGSPLHYPSGRIQKGLILAYGDRELAEEGVGFGLPVLKFGCETVFPGSAQVITRKNQAASTIEVNYNLNVVQRLAMNGKTLSSPAVYETQEYFARLHRNYPVLRRPGKWFFNNLQRICSIEERFEDTVSTGTASVVYTIPAGEGIVHVSVDLAGLKRDGRTDIVVANEQGAGCFDRYSDSDGLLLAGKAVGAWDEAFAREMSFADSCDGITFTLWNRAGAKMFRGREVLAGRLAWSGLNYVLPQRTGNFAYDIRIGVAQ